jgi:hypothetical protein
MSEFTLTASAITAKQSNYLSILLAERQIPEDFPVSMDNLDTLSAPQASRTIGWLKTQPKVSAAASADAAVAALVSGNYRLADGTVVKWSNNPASGAVFAVIDGKPQYKRHMVIGRQIVAEGKKMRAVKKAPAKPKAAAKFVL